MNIKIVNNQVIRLTLNLILVLAFYSTATFCLAQLPSKANYSTSTTHNCAGYECKKSLYLQEMLDINKKNITEAQYEAIIEKHINSIQTTQTTFPGFGSTVKKEIPNNIIDKALHCHKAKAQKTVWNNSKNKTAILKYRHKCWQLKVSLDDPKSHAYYDIVRINDITYTVKVHRTATACSSDLFEPHATEFKCIKKTTTEKAASLFRKSSLLALEDIPGNQFVKIKFDDNEHKFVLLDVASDLDFSNTENNPVNETPVADNTPPVSDQPTIPIGNNDPNPELEDEPEDQSEDEQPELSDDDHEEPEDEQTELEDESENEDSEHDDSYDRGIYDHEYS